MYSSVCIDELKKELKDNEKISTCARECNIFGDITTLKICYVLRHYPKMSVSDIAIIVESSISNVSHMLSKLKKMDIVSYKKVSKQNLYSIKDKKFAKFIDFLFLDYEK